MSENQPGIFSPQIILARGGNLSITTHLDQGKADQFIKASDMRRPIKIIDSDVAPEPESVRVGSDVLAWRSIQPFRELFATHFRQHPFYSLTRYDEPFTGLWEIACHERIIDQRVRSQSFQDRSEYEEKFLNLLNQSVKSGLKEALLREKLGWHDQDINYQFYILYSAFLPPNILIDLALNRMIPQSSITWLATLLLLHISLNFLDNSSARRLQALISTLPDDLKSSLPPRHLNRNWRDIWLPRVPVDKYFAGRLYLSQHGDSLIRKNQ